MTLQKKFPRPDTDYYCPLCPDHEDDLFCWSAILQTLICDGCDYEIWDAVVCSTEREPDSLILDRLEQQTELDFDLYRLIELDQAINLLEATDNTDQTFLNWLKKEQLRLQMKKEEWADV